MKSGMLTAGTQKFWLPYLEKYPNDAHIKEMQELLVDS